MRTKTLLLAAALTAAGIASSLAQSNVYSINVVGYINQNIRPGYSIITDHLVPSAGTGSISNLFKAMIDGSAGALDGFSVSRWTGTALDSTTWDDLQGKWVGGSQGNAELSRGEAVYVRNPTASNKTNTFVGDVEQGPLTVNLPNVYNLVGSRVPQAANVVTLGVNQGPDDSVGVALDGKNGAVDFSQFDSLLSQWTPIAGMSPAVDTTLGPWIKLGEGFFYRKAAPGATFTRNFTVQ